MAADAVVVKRLRLAVATLVFATILSIGSAVRIEVPTDVAPESSAALELVRNAGVEITNRQLEISKRQEAQASNMKQSLLQAQVNLLAHNMNVAANQRGVLGMGTPLAETSEKSHLWSYIMLVTLFVCGLSWLLIRKSLHKGLADADAAQERLKNTAASAEAKKARAKALEAELERHNSEGETPAKKSPPNLKRKSPNLGVGHVVIDRVRKPDDTKK